MQRRKFLISGLAVMGAPWLAYGRAANKKPISWWYEAAAPEDQENLRNLLVKVFNDAHPDQELSIDFRGQELDKQLRVAMLSGSGPDIVYTSGPSYVAPMAEAGQLL